MPAREVKATLLQCFITVDLVELRFDDGSVRKLKHPAARYVHLEGRDGLAVIEDDRLLEFRAIAHDEPDS